jgi:hypothetical protein
MTFNNSAGRRRRKRLPVAPYVADAEVFRPKRTDWERIQNAFGVRLGPTERAEVIYFVNDYFYVHELERRAPFAGDAIAWLKKLRASLQQVLNLMRRKADTAPLLLEAEDYARDNLVVLLRAKSGPRWTWGNKVSFVAQLEHACGKVIQDFETIEGGFKEGSAWKILITRLTEFAARNNFPFLAGKGGRTSPFVKFVRELQKTFPKAYRKHLQSDDALAEAISKARRRQKTNGVLKAK